MSTRAGIRSDGANALLAAACIWLSIAGGDRVAAQGGRPLPVPPAALEAQDTAHAGDYRLGFGDVLQIKFYYNAELNEQVPIRPDGKISLELVGEVPAAGLTPAALTADLKRRYGGTLKEPEIVVIVKEMASRRVYVAGEVNTPGVQPFGAKLSAVQSIFQAAGVKRSARLSNVVVLRYQGTAQPRFMTVDLKKALDGDTSTDIPLEPFDIVFVPKTRVARLGDFMDQYFRQILPIPLTLGITYVFGEAFQ